MRKINITRTVKNILLLLSIFLFFLVLLFGLLFSNFKEKAYINAKKDYELNIDKKAFFIISNASEVNGKGFSYH